MDQIEVVNFLRKFLKSLDISGLPSHILNLEIGVLIILLRNINQPKLCNDTRLVVKKLMNNLIEATILIGVHKGEDVLLPQIKLIPTVNSVRVQTTSISNTPCVRDDYQ